MLEISTCDLKSIDKLDVFAQLLGRIPLETYARRVDVDDVDVCYALWD